MNTLEQMTFVDRINHAESALQELSTYAESLANRLVGYADEATDSYPDSMPASGILPSASEAADRMVRKVDVIRRNLNRINQALPLDTVGVSTAALQGKGWVK